MNTAIKAEMASPSAIREAQTVMASLNKTGKQVVEKYDVSACTDITGFGLLGHCVEMASASDVTFELSVTDIAYLQDAYDYAKMGLVPAGAYKNKRYSIDKVEVGSVNETYLDLLCDPQTSGGLLAAVPAEEADKILRELKELSLSCAVIGEVIDREKHTLLIR